MGPAASLGIKFSGLFLQMFPFEVAIPIYIYTYIYICTQSASKMHSMSFNQLLQLEFLLSGRHCSPIIGLNLGGRTRATRDKESS